MGEGKRDIGEEGELGKGKLQKKVNVVQPFPIILQHTYHMMSSPSHLPSDCDGDVGQPQDDHEDEIVRHPTPWPRSR